MASIARVRHAGKVDALAELDEHIVEQLCREHAYHWRAGKLGPGRTVRCFAWQILMGNVPCDAVRHHGDGAFTASAYCQARQRLPESLLAQLSQRTAQAALARVGPPGKPGNKPRRQHEWRGHRVLRIDGSSTALPDTPALRRHFGCSGQQKRGCGYPTAHLLLLTGPAGIGVQVICSPLRTGDMTHATRMHEHLRAGDVLLGDRLFGGWAHLHRLQDQQLHGIFPAHHSRRIAWGRHAEHGPNRRWIKSLGYRDQLVEYRKPEHRPLWMSKRQFAAAPQWVRVREIERQVKVGGVRRTVVVVTTLTDAKNYPPGDVVKLLGERWLIETQLRALKTTMGMERLRCQSVDEVRKELLMYLIVYNLVRLLMLAAAVRQQVNAVRLSFADALATMRYGSGGGGAAIRRVALKIVPLRPGRVEPRVVKRRPKPFAKMSKPRAVLRHALQTRRRRAWRLA